MALLTPPEPFGKYVLVEAVATGGMAEIFRAKTTGPDGREQEVAIKRILPTYSGDEGFIKMFQDEAKLASHLKHENIVEIYDYGEVQGNYYIAMEFIRGRDLKDLIDEAKKYNKRLSIAQIVFIAMEMAKALDYAHALVVDGVPQKLVHRDVTPHNIMITMDGHAKLMDFGIAKAADRSTKTRAGVIKGKASYMSPEQARGKPLDGRSDMFTLGIIVWELLTGERLFAGDSEFDILRRVLRCDIKPIRQFNPNVPAELEAITLKMLAKNRDDRYRDCGELADTLANYFYSRCPGAPNHELDRFIQAMFFVNGHTPDEIPDESMGAPSMPNIPTTQAIPGLSDPSLSSNAPPSNPYLQSNPFTAAATSMIDMQNAPSDDHARPKTNTNLSTAQQYQETRMGFTALGPAYQRPAKQGFWEKNGILVSILLLITLLIGGIGAFVYFKIIKDRRAQQVHAQKAKSNPEEKEEKVQMTSVTFMSKPKKAEVTIEGQDIGQTPTRYNLPLGSSLLIKFSKKGYKSKQRVYLINKEEQTISETLERIVPKKKAQDLEKKVSIVTDADIPYEIYIDNQLIGENLKEIKLKIDENHHIELKPKVSSKKWQSFVLDWQKDQPTEKIEAKLTAPKKGPRKAKVPKFVTVTTKVSDENEDGRTHLVVQIIPWGKFKVDGKEVGSAPRVLEVTPGKHTVEAYYPAQNRRSTYSVQVKDRRDTRVIFKFRIAKETASSE